MTTDTEGRLLDALRTRRTSAFAVLGNIARATVPLSIERPDPRVTPVGIALPLTTPLCGESKTRRRLFVGADVVRCSRSLPV
jgi:hypothetical protein